MSKANGGICTCCCCHCRVHANAVCACQMHKLFYDGGQQVVSPRNKHAHIRRFLDHHRPDLCSSRRRCETLSLFAGVFARQHEDHTGIPPMRRKDLLQCFVFDIDTACPHPSTCHHAHVIDRSANYKQIRAVVSKPTRGGVVT